MTLVLKRESVLLAALAVAIHVFLFLTLHVPADGERAMAPPPRTSYLGANEHIVGAAETDVRLIQSPVIFAVPSVMGFSRELLAQKARTRIILSQPKQTEQFLSVVPLEEASARIPRNTLMVSAIGGTKPRLPDAALHTEEKRPAARRVFMVPILKQRLIGGVVLPAELNQESPKPWEIHASISVSKAGTVEHVFVEQPLESAALNQEVLQLLYRLRFKPGAQVVGSIEIYSPESMLSKEEESW